ncbi:MAG: hypothetical protein HYW26_04445 [Candidatus Aenigmarchaeota archaeon]|nr:hypothetical protein [Candidatus Aenigmarchaeota archaeon]
MKTSNVFYLLEMDLAPEQERALVGLGFGWFLELRERWRRAKEPATEWQGRAQGR